MRTAFYGACKPLLTALILIGAAEAQASIDIGCTFSVAGHVTASWTTNQGVDIKTFADSDSINLATPSIDNCNRSFEFASGAPGESGLWLISYAGASINMEKKDSGYSFRMRGTALTIADAETPLGAGNFATGEAQATVDNYISILSDKPLHYNFYTIGNRTGSFIASIPASGAMHTLESIGGVTEPNLFYASGDIYAAANVPISLRILHDHEPITVSHNGVDPNDFMSTGYTGEWEFGFTVTPVPEPASQWLMMSGLLGVFMWVRKRKIFLPANR